MDEREAIERIKVHNQIHFEKEYPKAIKITKALDMAVDALEKQSIYRQIKWERDVAIDQLKEIGLSLGEKVDKVREAMEKQIAKKPIFDEPLMVLQCPVCGNYLQTVVDNEGSTKGFIPCYCQDCGQKIDVYWRENK